MANANEVCMYALGNYIFAVRGQPCSWAGPGMPLDASVVGQSLRNALVPVKYTKFWVHFDRAAGANAPLILDTAQSISLLDSGVGDSAVPNGWTAGTLGLSDTNLPKGGALGETGYAYLMTGMSIAIDGAVGEVVAAGGLEIIPAGIRDNNGYLQALASTVIDNGSIVATSDDGNDMRVGLVRFFQQEGGMRSGDRSVSNGGPHLPGTYFPFARPLVAGDKNSGNKLQLTLSFSRGRHIATDDTQDAITGVALPALDIWVKCTALFYGVQVCMPDIAQCGVPSMPQQPPPPQYIPGQVAMIQPPVNPLGVAPGGYPHGYPSY